MQPLLNIDIILHYIPNIYIYIYILQHFGFDFII